MELKKTTQNKSKEKKTLTRDRLQFHFQSSHILRGYKVIRDAINSSRSLITFALDKSRG